MTLNRFATTRAPLAVFIAGVASSMLAACNAPVVGPDAADGAAPDVAMDAAPDVTMDAAPDVAMDVATDVSIDLGADGPVATDVPRTDATDDALVADAAQDAALAAFTVQILHASDQEAGLGAIDDAPRFSAVLRALEGAMPRRTLKLTNGDLWLPGVFYNAGGDPALSGVSQIVQPGPGRADIAMLNEMGWDAASFGNHEFDNGPREIANILFPTMTSGADAGVLWPGARFVYLSSNLDFSGNSDLRGRVFANDTLIDRASTTHHGRITGSVIFTVDGHRVGVVGATTPLLPQISRPESVVTRPASATDYAMLASIIQSRVDAITTAGVDKVIVMAHMQQFDVEVDQLAPRLRDVDVILAGGNHSVWADSDDPLRAGDTRANEYPLWRSNAGGEPVAILNTGANYRYVGRFMARFDARGVLIRAGHDSSTSGSYATDDAGVARLGAMALVDPEVRAIADAVRAVINSKDGVIVGRTSVYLNGLRGAVRTEETNFGALSADANLWAAREGVVGRSDATVVVSLKNGGGIRDSIGTIGAGATPTYEPPAANPAAGKLAGEVSQLDVENSLRFNNALSIVTVSAAQLQIIFEHAFSGVAMGATPGGFPQIGGVRVEYDPARTAQVLRADPAMPLVATAGARVRYLSVQLGGAMEDVIVRDGALVGDANRQIRLVTLSFITGSTTEVSNLAGDGYPFPRFARENAAFYNRVELDATPAVNDGFSDVGREQWALAEYFRRFHPRAAADAGAPFSMPDTPAAMDSRIRRL
jgi:2',3'-cyclic-nucleotide 2'-phosphodiesterase (5'-nucleotidase family)